MHLARRFARRATSPRVAGVATCLPTRAAPFRWGLVSTAPLRPHDPALRSAACSGIMSMPPTDSRTHQTSRQRLRRPSIRKALETSRLCAALQKCVDGGRSQLVADAVAHAGSPHGRPRHCRRARGQRWPSDPAGRPRLAVRESHQLPDAVHARDLAGAVKLLAHRPYITLSLCCST